MVSLEQSPVIAAVLSSRELDRAIAAPPQILFLLNTDILTLEETVRKIRLAEKSVFIHLDLAEGIGKDPAGIGYIRRAGATGIISTRANLIHLAKEQGLLTVQRFFIVDSHAIDTAIDSINAGKPDMVEIMPGVLPKVITRFAGRLKCPVIAGGLVESKREILEALGAGASAISTGSESLWYQ